MCSHKEHFCPDKVIQKLILKTNLRRKKKLQKVSIKGLFKRHTKRIFYDPPPPFKLVIKGNLEIKCFFRLLSICFFKNNLSQCQLTESAPSFSLSVPSSCCPAANCSKAELLTLILYPVSNTWVHFFKSSPPCL